jgi:hypothetical protein
MRCALSRKSAHSDEMTEEGMEPVSKAANNETAEESLCTYRKHHREVQQRMHDANKLFWDEKIANSRVDEEERKPVQNMSDVNNYFQVVHFQASEYLRHICGQTPRLAVCIMDYMIIFQEIQKLIVEGIEDIASCELKKLAEDASSLGHFKGKCADALTRIMAVIPVEDHETMAKAHGIATQLISHVEWKINLLFGNVL